MRALTRIAPAALLLVSACKHAPPPAPASAATSRGWIERSNQNAQILLDVQARFQPEQAARIGVSGIDDRVADFAPGHQERQRQATAEALAQLQAREQAEQDPMVKQDLAILEDAAKRQIQGSELQQRLTVPYYPLPRMIFGSIHALLDPQTAASRHPAALARVRKYAGLEPGTTPVVQLAEAETREGLQKGLLAPSRLEVQNDLETSKFLIAGIEKLFKQFPVEGSEQPVAELGRQLRGYLVS